MAESNITKQALANGLKELMAVHPFEKISIGQICDKCHMSRQSFYYHFKDKYDLIVSNPPYIPIGEMDTVSPEVEYEPETALVAGDDGMMFYNAIVENYKQSLVGGGMLAFEVGIGEADAVSKIMTDAGLENVKVQKDMNGIDRVVFGTVKSV